MRAPHVPQKRNDAGTGFPHSLHARTAGAAARAGAGDVVRGGAGGVAAGTDPSG